MPQMSVQGNRGAGDYPPDECGRSTSPREWVAAPADGKHEGAFLNRLIAKNPMIEQS